MHYDNFETENKNGMNEVNEWSDVFEINVQ